MLRDEENSLEKQLTPGRCRLSAAFSGGGRRTVAPRRTVAVRVEEANYQDLEKLAAGAFAVD
jgi:hypothetical protein